jgi:hypothetical protein
MVRRRDFPKAGQFAAYIRYQIREAEKALKMKKER